MTIPGNTYTAQASDGFLAYIKQGSEQVVRVKFRIIGGPCNDQSVEWTGFFGDSSFERTIQSLRYCGWQGNDVSDLTGIDRNEVEIVVENYTHKDKTYARVKYVNRIGGGARMPTDDARDFADSIMERIEALTPASGPEETVPF